MNVGLPLDDLYFEWLCNIVVDEGMPVDYKVLMEMYKTPFEPFIPNDQNRAEDGLALRQEFMLNKLMGTRRDRGWQELECSIFEMLIALADRVAFETNIPPRTWFWEFLDNLGVGGGRVHISTALKKLNRRTYAANGKGGLFPLREPQQDQREVEIWYQMSAYLLENEVY